MDALEYQIHFYANIMANITALFVLFAAWKWKSTARFSFFLIFGIACCVNWQTVIQSPEVYLNFAQVAVFPWYQQFITGWFMTHITLVISIIATCQGLIALAMLYRGWVYKAGVIGGTIFLLAVTPLGFGSAFPCTLILAFALLLLFPLDYTLFTGASSTITNQKHFSH